MNVNDMGVAELQLAVQELRRYPDEVSRLQIEIKQLKDIVEHALGVLQLDFGYSPENPCRYGHHPLRHQCLWTDAVEALGKIPDVEEHRVAEGGFQVCPWDISRYTACTYHH